MRLVLYQPEIAANVGAAIRNAACFGAALDIIEPCGFPLKTREIDRVALDYGALCKPAYHASWDRFLHGRAGEGGRLILLSTKSELILSEVSIQPEDVFVIGQESAGVPDPVRAACAFSAKIELAPGARSLNASVTGAIALAEARRQLGYDHSDTITGI